MENKRDKIIAALLTLTVAALTFTALLLTKVRAAVTELPHAASPEETEVFFADIDYEEILSDPTPQVDGEVASAAASEVSGEHLDDSGGGESEPDMVAAPAPRPEGQQVAKPQNPKPAAPTKEEIEAEKRARVRDRIGAASGLRASENAQSTGSASTGNASTGNNANADGLGLDGRKRLNKPDPGVKNASGWVKVRITVNAEGHVTGVKYVGSSGFDRREQEVRQACIDASGKLRYSPDSSHPSQSGVITWTIE